MFKVLVIAYYFPPMGLSGVQRTLKFTKYMSRFNWAPTVITTGRTAYFAHDKSLLKEAEEANIRIIRTEAFDPNSLLKKFGTVKAPRESIRRFLNRISQTLFIPDNKISWSKKVFKVADEILSKESFDAIFVTIPPFSAFKSAAKLKKKYDIPLFVDYRDLWYGSYFAFYPTPLHKYLHKKMEYQSLKAVEKIIVTNRKIKEFLLKTYQFLGFEDVIILRHGYDSEDFENAKPIPKENNKMILTYSGIFMEYATPYYFLKAFKKLSQERPDIAANIEVRFVGILGKKNQKLVKKLKLENFIHDYGYLEHGEAVRKIISSDVLWLMVGRRRNIDAILPGKIFEYIGSRKPYIACVPEGAAKIVSEEYGAAVITEPDDIEQIKNALIEVHSLYKQNKLPVPDEEFVLKHDRKELTEELTKQFQFYLKEIE